MKIEKFYNKKEKKEQYRARFQLNNKEFYPIADSRKKLLEIVDEIRAQEHRTKYDLPTIKYSPELSDVFDRHAPKIRKEHQRKLFERVARVFLSLLPGGIKITELKKAHFQKYIDLRSSQFGKQTRQPILPETIDKELYAISSALSAAPRYFAELEDYRKPEIPKASEGKRRRRTRLVNKTGELDRLLAELRKPRSGKQTVFHEKQRRRLADDLEFRFETGLRRKEVARLKKSQYFLHERALRDVVRWKTDTVTKFFPLSRRAVEIIESRMSSANKSEYIFTDSGEPQESDYRTLKTICAKLDISYGRYKSGGFVPHDLRHNFATEIVQVTDIETAKSLTGHTGDEIFTYLHTNEKLQREAVERRERRDRTKEIVDLYKAARRGKIRLKKFVEKIKILSEF